MGTAKREQGRVHQKYKSIRERNEKIVASSIEALNHWESANASGEKFIKEMQEELERLEQRVRLFYRIRKLFAGKKGTKADRRRAELLRAFQHWKIDRMLGSGEKLGFKDIVRITGFDEKLVGELIDEISKDRLKDQAEQREAVSRGDCEYRIAGGSPASYINKRGARQAARIFKWSEGQHPFVKYPYQSLPCSVVGYTLPVVFHYPQTFEDIRRKPNSVKEPVEEAPEQTAEK